MDLLLHLPDEIGERLQRWGNLSRRALEALAVAAYRADILTSREVQEMLGLSSRWETDEFLKKAGAYIDYTEADLARDIETIHSL